MPILRSIFFCLVFVAILLANQAQAGGSISREEFLDQVREPQVREFIRENFTLDEVGAAGRVGRESVEHAGERIAPFEILARSRTNGAPIVLQLGQGLLLLPCSASAHYDANCE